MSSNKVYEDLCYDDVNKTIVKLVWKITNFSQRTETMTSALFPTSAPDNLGKWRLELDRVDRRMDINIYEITSKVSVAKVLLSIFNIEDTRKLCEVREYRGGRCSVLTNCGFLQTKHQGFMPDNELTIVCQVEIAVHSETPSTATCEPPPCQLVEDLGMLLASGSLSDVTIAVAGAELKAHKNILAARSPVFAATFSNQMLEKETSVVEITDMEADVVQSMLEFIYTGKDVSQRSWAHDLLAAATKYQLERLKFMCEEALCKTLDLDNVLENLAHADLYSAARLKEQSITFIMEHRAEILKSPSWDLFKRSHQSLVAEIFERLCLQV